MGWTDVEAGRAGLESFPRKNKSRRLREANAGFFSCDKTQNQTKLVKEFMR
jgi:hypothetical protein